MLTVVDCMLAPSAGRHASSVRIMCNRNDLSDHDI